MTPAEYLDRLVASQILTKEETTALLQEVPPDQRPKDVVQLGRLLVQKGVLTRYQAAAVFQGNTRALVLGNYVVLDKIGAGGMGEVFKARHRVMDRTVAIKVLPATLVDSPEAVKRFHREVRAAARLIHPHIVTAFDAAEDKGIHFLAMEYVEGEDLAKIVDRDGPLAVADAVDYIMQAAEGLAYAHAQGMVHRDIKPHNLLLTQSTQKASETTLAKLAPDRIIKILDMGLARFETSGHGGATERFSITREDQIIGTVDYMSPEQAESTHTADQRSDIYSLGCTLYRLLTGQVPYTGDTAIRKLIAHREFPIPSLCDLRPDVPAGLQEVFARMLAKRPADRFPTMHDAIEALRPFGPAARQSARPDSPSDAEIVDEDSKLLNFMQLHATGSSSRINASTASSIGRASPAKETVAAPVAAAPAPRKPAVASPTQNIALQQSKQDTAKVARSIRARDSRRKGFPLALVLGGVGFAAIVLLGVAFFAIMSFAARSTKVVVQWPLAERETGQLIVDGQDIEFSDAEPLEIDVEPGTVTLQAMRRGFEPIDEQFEVAAGQHHVVQLKWVPVQQLGTVPSFDPETVNFDPKLNTRWPALFQQHADRQTAQAQGRTQALDEVKQLVAAAQSATADAAPTADALRGVQTFLQQHGGTAEQTQLGALLASLAAPADGLSRQAIPPHELASAGAGKASEAAAQLCAVLGDSRLQNSDVNQYAIAFARDNRTVATSGRSRIVNVFDATTHEQRWALHGHGNEVRALAFSPTEDRLASGGLDRRIKLWNMATGENTLTLLSTEAMNVYSLAFSPDGTWLASGSSDGLVRIWNVAIGQRRQELAGHTGNVVALAVSRDGKLLASSSDKGEVRIWDTSTWTAKAEFTVGGGVHSLAFHPTKSELVGGVWDTKTSRIFVWDFAGTSLRSFDEKAGVIYSLTFEPTGAKLFHMQGVQCRVWHYETAKIDVEFNTRGHYLALSPDSKTIATCGQASADVQLWNTAGQSQFDRRGHAGAVMAVSFTPDGRQLISGGQDDSVRVWDVASGKLQHTLTGHSQPVSDVACSPDGKLIASASHDNTVRMWNLATMAELPRLTGHSASVQAVVFSPDSKLVATCASDNSVRLWDANTGVQRELLTGHLQAVLDVAFSYDGAWLASASNDGEVRVWSVGDATCRLLLTEHAGPVRTLAFSPDGRWLATSGDDRQIVLIDLAKGTKSAAFAGHSHSVRSLTFSPDGKMLISAAAAPTDKPSELMIWEVETQIARRRIQGPLGEIFALAIDPLGRYIATAHRNGTVEILRAASRTPRTGP